MNSQGHKIVKVRVVGRYGTLKLGRNTLRMRPLPCGKTSLPVLTRNNLTQGNYLKEDAPSPKDLPEPFFVDSLIGSYLSVF